MRIIGGSIGGRVFPPPKSATLRPTTDRAREGLMNMLATRLDFDGLVAADFFSGTGAVGLELCSRGAKSVLSVEKQAKLVRYQQSLADETELPLLPTHSDVLTFLKADYVGDTCDFVFADPPYELPQMSVLPDLLFAWSGTGVDALVVVEHRKTTAFEKHHYFTEQRAYGEAVFSFFRNGA